MSGDGGSFLLCAFLLAGTAIALIALALLGKVHGVAWSLLLAAGLAGGGAALLGWRRAVRVAVQVVSPRTRSSTSSTRRDAVRPDGREPVRGRGAAQSGRGRDAAGRPRRDRRRPRAATRRRRAPVRRER